MSFCKVVLPTTVSEFTVSFSAKYLISIQWAVGFTLEPYPDPDPQ